MAGLREGEMYMRAMIIRLRKTAEGLGAEKEGHTFGPSRNTERVTC